MKTKKSTSALTDSASSKESKRAANRLHMVVKPKGKGATTTTRTAAQRAEAMDAAVSSNSTASVLGSVRQDWLQLPPNTLLARVRNAKDGLTGNLFYENLPPYILPTLTANESALVQAMENRAAAEALLRSARAAETLEMGNAVEGLRSAATACETIDRRDEALVSAGWELKRTASRPKPVPAPARLALKNTLYAGEVEARWARVSNAHFYEYQLAVSPTPPDPEVFENLPVQANGSCTAIFKGHPIGYLLTLRVRGNGSKGPSPWTETAVIRVN